jgi:hypothetical protein
MCQAILRYPANKAILSPSFLNGEKWNDWTLLGFHYDHGYYWKLYGHVFAV